MKYNDLSVTKNTRPSRKGRGISAGQGKTLAYATTVGAKMTGSKTEKAAKIGAEIAKKAKTAKIKKVVFDRGSKLYAGRLAALAEAARKEGLEF